VRIYEGFFDTWDYGSLEVDARAQMNGRSTSVDVVGIIRKPDVHVSVRIICQICIIDSDYCCLTGGG
jgi:hypothetical protein